MQSYVRLGQVNNIISCLGVKGNVVRYSAYSLFLQEIIFIIPFQLLILNMIDSENEGIRTLSIKFLEEMVILQSGNPTKDTDDVLSLDRLPNNLPFVKRKAMEEESE